MTQSRPPTTVIITGAGASRELGQDGRLPLMGDWSADIVQRLRRELGGLADVLGLPQAADLPDAGAQFELALGSFLQWSASLDDVESYLAFGQAAHSFAEDLPLPVRQWLGHLRANSKVAQQEIFNSLHDQFSYKAISSFHAKQAYGKLLHGIGVKPGDPLLFATTNYDAAIEIALGQLDRHPVWGEDAPFVGGGRVIRADGLAGMAHLSRTPVLHLHGAAGWYRDEHDRVLSYPGDPYNADHGAPALLLPSLTKDYRSDPLVSGLWAEFEVALNDAQRVLVLGHSLHDEYLVDCLRRHGPSGRGTKILVTVLPGPGVEQEAQRVIDLGINAGILSIEFGPEMSPETIEALSQLS